LHIVTTSAFPSEPGARRLAVAIVLAAIVLGFAAQPILSVVTSLGHNFARGQDLSADYATGWVTAIVLSLSIFLWPLPLRERLAVLALWGAKVIVALVFMLYYESFYGSLDAYAYFVASTEPTFDWSAVGMGSGTGNVMALAWLVGRVIPGSYHALKVIWAMIGLVAIMLFYSAACVAIGKRDIRVLVLLALTPSILFWSSILAKDPINLLGIALYVWGIVHWYVERRKVIAPVLCAVLGLAISATIRLWLVPILLLPLLILTLSMVQSRRVRAVILALGVAGVGGVMAMVKGQLFKESAVDLLSTAGQLSQSWALGGSAQTLSMPITTPLQVIKFLPLGMATALFRPLPGEVNNPFGALAGLENLALLALLFLAMIRTPWRELREPLVAGAIALIVAWAAVYGFISYQNLGTAVRFRLQIFPILILLVCYLARPRRA
jgi:hypothetical protein